MVIIMKHIALCSLLLLLLTQTVSCAQESPQISGSTTADTAPQTELTQPTDPLPTADFGGRTVNFYLAEEYSLLPVTESDGDVLNDAIYERNNKVADRYNVEFSYTVTPGAFGKPGWNEWLGTCESSILADDGSIDIIGGENYRLCSRALTNEMFQNLNEIDALDFSKPWWPQMFMEAANVGNALYFCQGNVDPSFWDRIYVLLLNKQLAKDYDIGDLYTHVKDGTWTFDKMIEIVNTVHTDLDGNSKFNENDLWGFASSWYMQVDAFNNAFLLEYVTTNDKGEFELVGLTPKIADACIKVKDFLRNSDGVFYSTKADDPIMFREGHTLLYPTNLTVLQDMRGEDIDIGILPYPKWDEAQEIYGTSCSASGAAAYCVPITADGAVSGSILEALAYYGYEDVLPVYYEKSLKGKNARDNESEEMLDIIFGNIFFDSSMIYSYIYGDQKTPSMLLRMTIMQNKDIASAFEADRQLYLSTLESINAVLQGE